MGTRCASPRPRQHYGSLLGTMTRHSGTCTLSEQELWRESWSLQHTTSWMWKEFLQQRKKVFENFPELISSTFLFLCLRTRGKRLRQVGSTNFAPGVFPQPLWPQS